MNSQRRKQLSGLIKELNIINKSFENIQSALEDIRDDEQDYRDNMPEGLAEGEKGDKADAAIESLDDAICAFDDIYNNVSIIIDYIEDAKK